MHVARDFEGAGRTYVISSGVEGIEAVELVGLGRDGWAKSQASEDGFVHRVIMSPQQALEAAKRIIRSHGLRIVT